MTKKRKIALAIAAAVLSGSLLAFAACKANQPEPPSEGGDSTVQETDKAPSELSANEVAFAYIGKQAKLESYETNTTGATKAKVLFINYNQNISDKGYKYYDEYYKLNVSSSTFANVHHEVFAKSVEGTPKVAYRNDDNGELSVALRDSYKQVYGVSPDDISLGGYIINNNTLKSAERLEGDSRYNLKEEYKGDLQYHFEISCSDEATAYTKLQMIQFGGLAATPEFSEIHMYLTISEDWTPRELITHSVYSTEKSGIGKFTCTQDITTTFSNVNAFETNPIPGSDVFNDAIGWKPSEVKPDEEVSTPTSDVANALMEVAKDVVPFADRIKNTGMHFGVDFAIPVFETPIIDINLGITKIQMDMIDGPVSGEIYVKYNEEDVQSGNYLNAVNFSISADLSGITQGNTIVGAILMPMLPTIVSSATPDLDPSVMSIVIDLSDVSSIDVYYTGTGCLYITFTNNDGYIYKIITITIQDLLPLVLPYLGGIIGTQTFALVEESEEEGGSDLDSLLTKIITLFEENFTVEKKDLLDESQNVVGTDTVLSLIPETVAVVAEGYNSLVDMIDDMLKEYIQDYLGRLGGTVADRIDIKGKIGCEIYSGALHFVRSEDELKEIYFEFRGYTEDDKKEANLDENGVPLTDHVLARIGVTNDGDLKDELAENNAKVAKFLADEAVASVLRNYIDWLDENMWIDANDTFKASLSGLENQFNRLTDEQKALVTNAAKIGISGYGYSYESLSAKYDRLKKAANEFLTYFDGDVFKVPADDESWINLSAKYKEWDFNAAQIEYISQEKIDAYLEEYTIWANSKIENLTANLAALKEKYLEDGDVKSDITLDELIELIRSTVNGSDKYGNDYSLELYATIIGSLMPEELYEEYKQFENTVITYAVEYVYEKLNVISGMVETVKTTEATEVNLDEVVALKVEFDKIYANFATLSAYATNKDGDNLKWYELVEEYSGSGAEIVKKLTAINDEVNPKGALGVKVSSDFTKALKNAANTQYGAVKTELLKGYKKGGTLFKPTYEVDSEYMNSLTSDQRIQLQKDVNRWHDILSIVNDVQPALSGIDTNDLDKFCNLLNEWMANNNG